MSDNAKDRVRTRLVSIEGNIGCGKSTALACLKALPNVQVHPEPVERCVALEFGTKRIL